MRNVTLVLAIAAIPSLARASADEIAFPTGGSSYFYAGSGASVISYKSLFCSGSKARWDVPKGSLVSTQASLRTSPVRRGIESMTGFRTHSILSNGGDWVTQATIQYKTNGETDVCDNQRPPFNEGRTSIGFPGASQVNMAALYNYLYVNDGISYIAQQSGNPGGGWRTALTGTTAEPIAADPGGAIADWAWSSMPYGMWNPTLYTGGSCVTSGRAVSCSLTGPVSGAWYQLYDANNKPIFYKLGNMAHYSTAQTTNGTGAVCSDFLYRLQYWSKAMKFQYVPPVSSSYITIPHDNAVAGVKAFRNQVTKLCQDQVSGTTVAIGEFLNLLSFGLFGCSRSKNSICDGAGDQMARCIVSWSTSCAEQYPHYTTIIAPSSFKMESLSPDALGGWAPFSTTFSVWAWSADGGVNWNSSGGTQYGCWTNP